MDELAKRFADLAEKYGPTVVDAAMGAVRVEAYSSLASSLLWFASAALCLWSGRFLWRKAAIASRAEDDIEMSIMIYAISTMAFIVGALLALPGIWAWLDPWTWTALNHPELYLAKHALKL